MQHTQIPGGSRRIKMQERTRLVGVGRGAGRGRRSEPSYREGRVDHNKQAEASDTQSQIPSTTLSRLLMPTPLPAPLKAFLSFLTIVKARLPSHPSPLLARSSSPSSPGVFNRRTRTEFSSAYTRKNRVSVYVRLRVNTGEYEIRSSDVEPPPE